MLNNREELLKTHFNRSFNLNCHYDISDLSLEEKLSEKNLLYLINKYEDINQPREVPNNYNAFFLARDNITFKFLTENVDSNLRNSGYFWYPPYGYCGWHTNSRGMKYSKRTYFVWAAESNKSFFRTWDGSKINTYWDQKGWNEHTFEVGMWHCVGSYTNRISIGFKHLDSYNEDFKNNT